MSDDPETQNSNQNPAPEPRKSRIGRWIAGLSILALLAFFIHSQNQLQAHIKAAQGRVLKTHNNRPITHAALFDEPLKQNAVKHYNALFQALDDDPPPASRSLVTVSSPALETILGLPRPDREQHLLRLRCKLNRQRGFVDQVLHESASQQSPKLSKRQLKAFRELKVDPHPWRQSREEQHSFRLYAPLFSSLQQGARSDRCDWSLHWLNQDQPRALDAGVLLLATELHVYRARRSKPAEALEHCFELLALAADVALTQHESDLLTASIIERRALFAFEELLTRPLKQSDLRRAAHFLERWQPLTESQYWTALSHSKTQELLSLSVPEQPPSGFEGRLENVLKAPLLAREWRLFDDALTRCQPLLEGSFRQRQAALKAFEQELSETWGLFSPVLFVGLADRCWGLALGRLHKRMLRALIEAHSIQRRTGHFPQSISEFKHKDSAFGEDFEWSQGVQVWRLKAKAWPDCQAIAVQPGQLRAVLNQRD